MKQVWITIAAGLLLAGQAEAQDEQHRALLMSAWGKTIPAGQVCQIRYTITTNLSGQGESIRGEGTLLPGDRGLFRLTHGGKPMELYQKNRRQAMGQGKQPIKRVTHELRKKHPALVSFISGSELVERLVGAGGARFVQRSTRVVDGTRCRLYRVTLERGDAEPLLRRLGLTLALKSGKKAKQIRYRAVFSVDIRRGSLRRIDLSLRTEVASKKKKSKSKKDWSWESYSDQERALMRPQDKPGEDKDGGAAPSGLEKTGLREYTLHMTFSAPKRPEKALRIPAAVRQLLGW